ncbi:hypothetical protein E1265_25605 [Streptomyces sp. 8K308]|uniref:hypothetical protein n=1 Tax=Streptomyces sp. 8K308 TaxID=2530388 RepID=UPI0010501376|nr:hypothetical protein [Streptomyces sp. 8K308]TDC18079.1 hypothetical protein E1265_25605 [Streptomyces sp. 8K308]
MDDMSDRLSLAAQRLNEYTVTPGVLGFIVFAVLGVAVWVLLKSMSRHLGRISVKDETKDEIEGTGEGAGEPEKAASAASGSSSA